MHAKRVLIVAAAMLVASQAYALTAYEKHLGCSFEVGDCPGQNGGGGGGGGGGGEMSNYTGAWIYEGSLWESFEDSQGGFDIETNQTTGKKTVHMGNVAGFLIKYPTKEKMKRSALVHGAMMPAQTLAEAKKKADEAAAKAKAEADKKAAKAAADKAFQDQQAALDAANNQAAADKAKADAVYKGPGINSAPGGQVKMSTDRKKP